MSVTVKDGNNRFKEVEYTVFKTMILDILSKELIKFKGESGLTKFKRKGCRLIDIGICTGFTVLLDKAMSVVKDGVSILDTDTYSKFKSDLERDFNNE